MARADRSPRCPAANRRQAYADEYEPQQLQDTSPIASAGGVLSLIPNREALLQAARAAGFSRVQELPVPAGMNPQYTEGHRLVVAAWP